MTTDAKLPHDVSSSTYSARFETETRYVYHASAGVYYPAPDGATYTNSATCTHDHLDWRDAEDCAQRLVRIINSGRVPKWATLTYPIPAERPQS